MGTPPPRVVVGAAVVRDGRLLAARRTGPPALAGRWELPGGKVEPGESWPAALARELAEELGLTAVVGAPVGEGWPLSPTAELRVFVVTLPAGVEPVPAGDHDAVVWLSAEEVWDVDWLEGDRPAVAAIARLLAAPPA